MGEWVSQTPCQDQKTDRFRQEMTVSLKYISAKETKIKFINERERKIIIEEISTTKNFFYFF